MRFSTWLAIAAMTVFFPLSAMAAIDLGATGLANAGINAGVSTSGANSTLVGLVGSILTVALNLIGVILFILFIYSGFLWMTAQGEAKQVQKAKDIMGNALIGLLLVFLAYSITYYAISYLSDGQINNAGLTDLTKVAGNAGLNTALTDPIQNIGYYLSVVLNLLGVVLLAIFIYAGFLWMTAQGDPKQVDKAKTMMRNAIIGLIIIFFSRLLADFIIAQLQ